MTYAFSVAAMRATARGGETRHSVGVIIAASRDEANGLALAISRKIYPKSKGWDYHDALTCPCDRIVTLETAYVVDQEDSDRETDAETAGRG